MMHRQRLGSPAAVEKRDTEDRELLHTRGLRGFTYYRAMKLTSVTCTSDHHHDSKYALHRHISPCDWDTRGRMQP